MGELKMAREFYTKGEKKKILTLLDENMPEPQEMSYAEAIERLGSNNTDWELKRMLKANSSGENCFC